MVVVVSTAEVLVRVEEDTSDEAEAEAEVVEVLSRAVEEGCSSGVEVGVVEVFSKDVEGGLSEVETWLVDWERMA